MSAASVKLYEATDPDEAPFGDEMKILDRLPIMEDRTSLRFGDRSGAVAYCRRRAAELQDVDRAEGRRIASLLDGSRIGPISMIGTRHPLVGPAPFYKAGEPSGFVAEGTGCAEMREPLERPMSTNQPNLQRPFGPHARQC